MGTLLQKHWFKIGVLVTLTLFLIGCFGLMFHVLVTQPEQERQAEKIERDRTEFNQRVSQLQREEKLEECEELAWSNYNSSWDFQCNQQGHEAECEGLPGHIADDLLEELKGDREQCWNRYGD